MRLALYHPAHGYYAKPRRIGRAGDFFTSVSVGECFGMLLARQVREIWDQWRSPADFAIIEQGAHDGQLAADLRRHFGEGEYVMVEPNAAYREAQRERVPGVRHVERLEMAGCGRAVFVCNELIDAFPVRRFRFLDGSWREIRVGMCGDSFCEIPEESGSTEFPYEVAEGHIVERCFETAAWMRSLFAAFEEGVVFILDYGMEEADLFLPERHGGTLRCYRGHRATDDPFEEVGETDITWQVNFTQLRAEAEAAGFTVMGYLDQGQFLTGIAEDWLKTLDGAAFSKETAAMVRQFQTLTHPGTMGRVFKVLVLGKGSGVPLKLSGLRWHNSR